ncbi:hypothetical protein NPIL_533461 [Nephila pilipes]|uniref:Uncharacterized protein n=1 Tax=Nephila pilipes TaxID=299642 RepID=A0A8X6Q4U0_NEPPI|nr:hypothetical protein NPIL_533461 [Nephila pilipes]
MVIPIDSYCERGAMFSKDYEFKPGDIRWSERPARLQHRFLVLRKLGQGTYGKVQLALNKETNQENTQGFSSQVDHQLFLVSNQV